MRSEIAKDKLRYVKVTPQNDAEIPTNAEVVSVKLERRASGKGIEGFHILYRYPKFADK